MAARLLRSTASRRSKYDSLTFTAHHASMVPRTSCSGSELLSSDHAAYLSNQTVLSCTSFLSCSEDTMANLDHLLATRELEIREWELPKLVSSVAVAVLRDGITALQILHTTSQLPVGNVQLDWIGSKTLVEMLESSGFDDTIQTHIKDRLQIDREKIERDRALMEVILVQTVNNLEKEHNFGGLVKIIENFLRKREEEEILLTSVVRDERKMLKLRKKKEKNLLTFQKTVQEIVQATGRLKDEYMDTMFENEAKVKFLDKWENARKEQNKIILDSKENDFDKGIKEANAEIVKEKLVHGEIVAFLNEMITDYQQDIEQWMTKYDTDIDQKEIDCHTMKSKLDDQHETLENLEKKFKERQQEIDDYLVVRERRREERAEFYRRNHAATKIQAWWRGVMFRKGLGPYKKKKKGKKGDKGKKGSNGKKKK